jgi:transposase-like protein
MILCPLCDGQGAIYKAKIITKNIQIYICEECDSMWTTMNIQTNNCVNFKKFMNELGLKGLWEELSDIDIL